MEFSWGDDVPARRSERSIDELNTNARLRRSSASASEGVIEFYDDRPLSRWAWVGGQLIVDEDCVSFRGYDHASHHEFSLAANGIQSVGRRRGVTGVPFVSVMTTDGAELWLRAGAFGSKSGEITEAIQALQRL